MLFLIMCYLFYRRAKRHPSSSSPHRVKRLRGNCLRSRPATPTAVFATSPAPEAANASAAAASARRSSAEGTVSDALVSAACAERSKASRSAMASLSRHVSFLQKRGLANLCRPRPFLATLLSANPQSQLVARRPKVPPATSYTFRLFSDFSLNNIHWFMARKWQVQDTTARERGP